MSISMITNLIILISSQIGFLYGIFTILIKKKPLYLKMVVLAMACMTVGRIFVMLQYITKDQMPDVFNIGMLGMVGCFLFLFSANYGMIDGLTDDGSREFLKYRIISWLIPALIVAGFIPAFLYEDHMSKKISYTIVVLFIALASRYHFKHLIFPDVDYGVVRAIRGYNLIAMVLCFSAMIFIGADMTDNEYALLGAGIVMSVCCLVIIPLLRKEATKWTTV